MKREVLSVHENTVIMSDGTTGRIFYGFSAAGETGAHNVFGAPVVAELIDTDTGEHLDAIPLWNAETAEHDAIEYWAI